MRAFLDLCRSYKKMIADLQVELAYLDTRLMEKEHESYDSLLGVIHVNFSILRDIPFVFPLDDISQRSLVGILPHHMLFEILRFCDIRDLYSFSQAAPSCLYVVLSFLVFVPKGDLDKHEMLDNFFFS